MNDSKTDAPKITTATRPNTPSSVWAIAQGYRKMISMSKTMKIIATR